jgi:uncharacterized membrane protein
MQYAGFPWLFLAVIFLVIFVLTSGRKYRFRDGAMDLLRERYVKGEITKQEFEERRNDLMK